MDPGKTDRDVDQWLDEALSQYSKTEPRVGLESRVLANLRDERSRLAASRRWWWATGMATATAVAIAMAVWIGKSGHERNPVGTMGASTTAQREQRALVQSVPSPHVSHPAREIRQRAPVSGSFREVVVTRMPKLELFPSRRDLSEEELLLVRHLNKQSDNKVLLEASTNREEVDLSIGSLEIRPLQIPDIEILDDKTN